MRIAAYQGSPITMATRIKRTKTVIEENLEILTHLESDMNNPKTLRGTCMPEAVTEVPYELLLKFVFGQTRGKYCDLTLT